MRWRPCAPRSRFRAPRASRADGTRSREHGTLSVMPIEHKPVLATELVELLAPAAGPGRGRLHLRGGRPRAPRRLAARRRRDPDLHRPRPGRRGALRALLRRGHLQDPLHRRRLRGRASHPRRRRRPPRHDLHGPRNVLDAGRCLGAGLLLLLRRAARHAHGLAPGVQRRRPRQRVARVADRPGPAPLRRGALRRRDRPRDRQAAPAADDLGARRRGQGRDAGQGPLRRRPPGQAHLPGDPDRRQRRARLARGRAADRLGHAADRRPPRRDLLPLAGGPPGQAVPRRARPRAASARPSCRSAPAAASPKPTCSPAARSRPGRRRSPPTPAPSRPTCAPR